MSKSSRIIVGEFLHPQRDTGGFCEEETESAVLWVGGGRRVGEKCTIDSAGTNRLVIWPVWTISRRQKVC